MALTDRTTESLQNLQRILKVLLIILAALIFVLLGMIMFGVNDSKPSTIPFAGLAVSTSLVTVALSKVNTELANRN